MLAAGRITSPFPIQAATLPDSSAGSQPLPCGLVAAGIEVRDTPDAWSGTCGLCISWRWDLLAVRERHWRSGFDRGTH